mgnify:CR=1 FL=1
MYSKLILFFFQRNKISPPFSLAFKQRRKVLKNTTNIRFFFYMYERKRNFFRIVIREQRIVIWHIIEH